MASEAASSTFAGRRGPQGRLQPGRSSWWIRPAAHRRRRRAEGSLRARGALREWLRKSMLQMENLRAEPAPLPERESLVRRQQAFGYTFEEVKLLITPWHHRQRAVGRWDRHAAGVLSERPRPLFDYFKQLFAQSPTRRRRHPRRVIMASDTTIGRRRTCSSRPNPAGSWHCPPPSSPTTSWRGSARWTAPCCSGLRRSSFRPCTTQGDGAPAQRPGDLRWKVSECLARIQRHRLSDRGHDADNAPIPSLLAVSRCSIT